MSVLEERLEKQDIGDSRFQFLDSEEKIRQQIFDRRQAWFGRIPSDKKKAMLFELEMLLLGIQRFLDESKASTKVEHAATKDFSREVEVLKDSLAKVRKISHELLVQGDPTLAFRQYMGETIADDRLQNLRVEEKLGQLQPEDSLYFLYSSFQSFWVLLDFLAQKGSISFSVFEHLSNLVAREMRTNLYFSPQNFEQFTPLYDRIRSEGLVEFIHSIRVESLRKIVSVVLLVLFRILNYVRFIPRPCLDLAGLRKGVIILSLVSTELKNLIKYINEDLLKAKSASARDHHELKEQTKLMAALEKIGRGLESEHARVYAHELVGLDQNDLSPEDRSRSLEISYQIIKNVCEYYVVECVQVFDPNFNGDDIFDGFISPRDRSAKLRDDLMLFEKIIDNFFDTIRGQTGNRIAPYFRSIMEFSHYFRSVEFQSLRLQEYAFFKEFTEFSEEFSDKVRRKEASARDAEEFKEFLSNLKPFVGKTIEQVSKRAELKGVASTPEHIQKIFLEYIQRFKSTTT